MARPPQLILGPGGAGAGAPTRWPARALKRAALDQRPAPGLAGRAAGRGVQPRWWWNRAARWGGPRRGELAPPSPTWHQAPCFIFWDLSLSLSLSELIADRVLVLKGICTVFVIDV